MALPFLDVEGFLAHLRAGGVGVIPTDTVPGMVALPDYAEAIYTLKGRDRDKPLILLGDSSQDLRLFTRGWLPAWATLANRGWPGALTLVLPASDRVSAQIHRGQETIGVRIPNHAEARALLARSGPLVSTSVNPSGTPALLTPEDIHAAFPDLPLLVGTYAGSGTASTVVRWRESEWSWEILRQGSFRV